jgi:hypothetical protein
MTSASWNSTLLDNGSLTHVSIKMRIRGDRLGKVRIFCVNGINNFHGYALDYKARVKRRLIQTQFIGKGVECSAVSVNQWTTEAEEVTDS